MPSSSGSKSALERRLRELKKESSLVRDDIRSLSKALKTTDDHVSIPRLKSDRYARPAVPPPTRRDPVAAPAPPPAAAGEQHAPHAGLFEWAKGAAGREPKPGRPAPPEPVNGGPRNTAVRQDERFANYFSTGNFLGGKPLKRERSVQRNRAIVMLVAVIIFAFIVFNLLFR